MPHSISVELSNQTLTGQVTDMDALFFAGLILPEYFKIRDQEKGLRAAFDKFSQDNAAALAQAGVENSEELSNQMYNAWGERLLIRLTDNLTIRSAFAQRVCEIFPEMDSQLVFYDRWTDADGNIHENSRIRLDLDEVMDIITPAIAVLTQEKTGKQKATSKLPPQAEKTGGLESTVAQLTAELEKLKSQIPPALPASTSAP